MKGVKWSASAPVSGQMLVLRESSFIGLGLVVFWQGSYVPRVELTRCRCGPWAFSAADWLCSLAPRGGSILQEVQLRYRSSLMAG
jgi:hypothetical protein